MIRFLRTSPLRTSPLLLALLLSGCAMGPTQTDGPVGPVLAGPNQQVQVTPVAAQTEAQTPQASALMDVAAFLDGSVIASLSAKDKAEAASAQFNALTFGRPGAPRAWAGDSGAKGQVQVGPYVRVNNRDCRTFTHSVTVAGKTYDKTGMACREEGGNWAVEA